MANDIQVYGMNWCGLTFGVREYLTNTRVTYDYHDVERDAEANEFAITLTDGRRHFPIVVVHERVLTNPSRIELQRVLDDYDIQPDHDPHRRRIAPYLGVRSRRR